MDRNLQHLFDLAFIAGLMIAIVGLTSKFSTNTKVFKMILKSTYKSQDRVKSKTTITISLKIFIPIVILISGQEM